MTPSHLFAALIGFVIGVMVGRRPKYPKGSAGAIMHPVSRLYP